MGKVVVVNAAKPGKCHRSGGSCGGVTSTPGIDVAELNWGGGGGSTNAATSGNARRNVERNDRSSRVGRRNAGQVVVSYNQRVGNRPWRRLPPLRQRCSGQPGVHVSVTACNNQRGV